MKITKLNFILEPKWGNFQTIKTGWEIEVSITMCCKHLNHSAKKKKTYWLNKNKTFDLEQELAKFRACKGLTQCIELKFLNIIMA